MRESLRGALLSVLFFGLMVGGVPGVPGALTTIAEATNPCGAGQTVSYTRGGPPCRDNNPKPDFCGSLKKNSDMGVHDVGFGAGAASAGALGLGALMGAATGPAAAAAAGLTTLGWGLTRIGKGICKGLGKWD